MKGKPKAGVLPQKMRASNCVGVREFRSYTSPSPTRCSKCQTISSGQVCTTDRAIMSLVAPTSIKPKPGCSSLPVIASRTPAPTVPCPIADLRSAGMLRGQVGSARNQLGNARHLLHCLREHATQGLDLGMQQASGGGGGRKGEQLSN